MVVWLKPCKSRSSPGALPRTPLRKRRGVLLLRYGAACAAGARAEASDALFRPQEPAQGGHLRLPARAGRRGPAGGAARIAGSAAAGARARAPADEAPGPGRHGARARGARATRLLPAAPATSAIRRRRAVLTSS